MSKIITTFILVTLITPPTLASEPPLCPQNNQLISTLSLPTEGNQWIFHDNIAYITTDDRKLIVVDFTNPNSPQILSTSTTSATTHWEHARIHNNTLYMFWGLTRISTTNILDPSNPIFLGTYLLPSGLHTDSFSLFEDYLYILSNRDTCAIFNIADPSNPTFVTSSTDFETPLAIFDDIAYSTRMNPLDLTDPTHPITIRDLEQSAHFVNTYKIGQYLFFTPIHITSNSGKTLDISEPHNPILLNNNYLTSQDHGYTFIRGSIQYKIADFTFHAGEPTLRYGLALNDFSNPIDFIEPTRIELTNSPINQVHSIDPYVFLLTGDTIQTFTIDPKPTVASHPTAAPANDIALTDTHAFLVNDGGSLQSFDITSPTNPILKSTLQLSDNALSIAIQNTIAYIATDRDKLNIIDIQDPNNPTLISNIDVGRRGQDTLIIDNTLYYLDRFVGLFIFDITDPTNPLLLSDTGTIGRAKDITIDESTNLAYITTDLSSIYIVDIADNSNPHIINTFEYDGSTNFGSGSSTIHNNRLYIAAGMEGYFVFDVTNPLNPKQLHQQESFLNPRYFSHQIQLIDNMLYLANGTGGFATLYNANPIYPIQNQSITTNDGEASSIRRFIIKDNLVYAAVYEGGFRIYNPCPNLICPVDYDSNGTLNFFDVTEFIEKFNHQLPKADLNGDQNHDFFDISMFFDFFMNGCP